MSRIVAAKDNLNKRQVPLVIEDCPKLIIEFDDLISTCQACGLIKPSNQNTVNNKVIKQQQKKDYQQFLNKYSQLVYKPTRTETSNSSNSIISLDKSTEEEPFRLEAKQTDLVQTISQLVTCIGCKTSVERFYKQLIQQQSTCLVLDPILVDSNGSLSLKASILSDPALLYSLFYLNCSQLTEIIPKIKRNRRCYLHSLDMHKHRNINDWLSVWEALGTDECRNKAISIEVRQLVLALENYLRKHKFCADCKTKVIRAFNILVGDLDPSKEKGFCSTLFQGIECICSNEHSGCQKIITNSQSSLNKDKYETGIHRIQLRCDRDYLMNLVLKAEPEIHGSRRERHAKTIETAQEEVLTCIGIYLYERFQRIYQAMRSEEQTWQILFYASLITLKKCYELELERRQGISKLELLCAELAATTITHENSTTVNHCFNSTSTKGGRGRAFRNGNKKKNKKKLNQKTNELKDQQTSVIKPISSLDSSFEKSEEQKNDSNYSSCSSEEEDDYVIIDSEIQEERVDEKIPVILEEPETNICCTCTNEDQSTIELNKDARSSSLFTQTDHNYNFEFDIYQSNFYFPDKTKQNLFLFDSANDLSSSSSSFADSGVGGLITDEEKNEYYANKSILLNQRRNRREMLKQRFQNFKLNANNFKLRPRNVS